MKRRGLFSVLCLAPAMAIALGVSGGANAADKTPKIDPFIGLVPKTLDLRTVRVFQENRDRIDGTATTWLLRYKGAEAVYIQFGDADAVSAGAGTDTVEGVAVDIRTADGATLAIWQTPEDLYVPTHLVATKQSKPVALELTARILRQLKSGKTIDSLADGVVVVESARESYDALSIVLADGSRIKSTENPREQSEKLRTAITRLLGEFAGPEHQPDDVDGWIWDAKNPPPGVALADSRSLRLSEVRKVIQNADREAVKLVRASTWLRLPKSMKAGWETSVGNGGSDIACLQVKTNVVCSMGPFVSRLIKDEWYVVDMATGPMTVESAKGKVPPLAVVEDARLTYTVVAIPKNVNAVKLKVRRNLRFETVTVERPRW
jgi:hypothetical protein